MLFLGIAMGKFCDVYRGVELMALQRVVPNSACVTSSEWAH